MERAFALEQITLDEFNRINNKLGRPLQAEDQNKAYFKIRNEVSYTTLPELLMDLKDEYQKPRLVWFKDSGIKISEARKQMREGRDKYYQMLISQQIEYSHLVAELSSNPSNHLLSDMLDFQKVNGHWLLTNFYIRHQNLGFYEFYEFGIQIHVPAQVILGVYEPNEPAAQLKPGNPVKTFFGWLAGKGNAKR